MAAEEEAAELRQSAGSDADRLQEMLARRLAGQPLAWVTGSVTFGGLRLRVDPGVYVPRWQTEPMARRAAELLPPGGRAIDLCTGAGPVAAVLLANVAGAQVIATDTSAAAVACARANGVDARLGDLDDPVPSAWAGGVDLITAVVPYVPTEELHLLDRDSREHEPRSALDGGPGGTRWLEEVIVRAPRWLRSGRGAILLEVGGDQPERLAPVLAGQGFGPARVHHDEDGDMRALEAVLRA